MINDDNVIYLKSSKNADKNEMKVFELYLKSAESGNAIAQNNLGNCYQNGNLDFFYFILNVNFYC